MLDTGYKILDAGCWMLDAGYWILDTGYKMQDTGYRIQAQDTGTRYKMLDEIQKRYCNFRLCSGV